MLLTASERASQPLKFERDAEQREQRRHELQPAAGHEPEIGALMVLGKCLKNTTAASRPRNRTGNSRSDSSAGAELRLAVIVLTGAHRVFGVGDRAMTFETSGSSNRRLLAFA